MKQGQSKLQPHLTLILLAGTVLLASQRLGAGSKPDQLPKLAADKAFAALVDKYLDGLYHFSPARATRQGFHQYDAELPDYSRRVVEAEIARVKACLADLDRISKNSLSKDNRFDARLLEGSMRGDLLDLEQLRRWENDPNYYNGAISFALFVLIQRDFAPVDDRLRSLIAREQQVPEIFRSARANVSNPPAIYTTIAVRQVQSEIAFLKNDLPQAVAGARNAKLAAQFQQVNQQTIKAYEEFLEYLKTDLAPRSHGAFAIGEENYRKKLLYDEMVDAPIDQLIALGERELRKTQAAFQTTAALIDPAKPATKVLEDLSRDHPDAAHVLSESQAVLDN